MGTGAKVAILPDNVQIFRNGENLHIDLTDKKEYANWEGRIAHIEVAL